MKPRVVILSAFLSPFRSGAEACVEEVALRIADEFDVAIVTAKLRRDLPRSDLLAGKIPIIRVGIGAPIDKWLFPFLAPFAARRRQPSIIHAVLESYAGLALIVCRWVVPRAKRILTCQSTNTSLMLGAMHRTADRVTAISSVLVERAKKLGKNDAMLIPNGINVAEIRRASSRHPKVPGRILFVGRLEWVKGVDVLLRGWRQLSENFGQLRNNLTLHIVGDGSQRQSLEQLAGTLGIADRVRFVGRLTGPELLREYAEAEIFCGLSRSEALGNVFLEAQAAGCAVVATRVGGIPDIVRDGETGLLVAPDDPEAAAAALGQLLMDALFRQRLAEEGKKLALGYDWQEFAKRYAAIYRGVA